MGVFQLLLLAAAITVCCSKQIRPKKIISITSETFEERDSLYILCRNGGRFLGYNKMTHTGTYELLFRRTGITKMIRTGPRWVSQWGAKINATGAYFSTKHVTKEMQGYYLCYPGHVVNITVSKKKEKPQNERL